MPLQASFKSVLWLCRQEPCSLLITEPAHSTFLSRCRRSISFHLRSDVHKATEFARKVNALRLMTQHTITRLLNRLCAIKAKKDFHCFLFFFLFFFSASWHHSKSLWFKGIDGWLKGVEMRMEMRLVIWVNHDSSVPVVGWKFEGRPSCEVVYILCVCLRAYVCLYKKGTGCSEDSALYKVQLKLCTHSYNSQLSQKTLCFKTQRCSSQTGLFTKWSSRRLLLLILDVIVLHCRVDFYMTRGRRQ